MKIILNTFLITLFSFASYAQEYVWSVYNIKVDRVNAGQVVSAMDNYLSQPGNLVDGVTVSLFEIFTLFCRIIFPESSLAFTK